ncbi:MAG: FtsQ-type POTRA domain-containing protein [Thermodesulfobacteria bacterium]|nr:FtsQ-type POTRA domain-containing protein [Thermodesulfobacteriota bacterium]
MRRSTNQNRRSKGAFGDVASKATFLSRVLLLTGLICLLMGGIVGTVYGIKKWMRCCPYFFVTRVEVEGAHRLSKKALVELSSIKEGDNIFSLDLDAIRNKILENPWVRNASVERRLPDKIIIHIDERTPFALARIHDRIYLVDKYGEPFKPLEPKENFSAPVITGVELKDAPATKGPALVDEEKMKIAISIVKMSKRGVRALGFNNISQIDFPNDHNVVIYTADKAVPFLLDRDKYKKQFYRAEKILVQLYNSGQYPKVISVNVGYGQDMALARLKKR